MVVGVTLLLCLSLTAIHCNIEFKHHNNTELAAILQKVSQTNQLEPRLASLWVSLVDILLC